MGQYGDATVRITRGTRGACLVALFASRGKYFLNPSRTAVPFWGQSTWNVSGLSPKRDCGSKKEELPNKAFLITARIYICGLQSRVGDALLSIRVACP